MKKEPSASKKSPPKTAAPEATTPAATTPDATEPEAANQSSPPVVTEGNWYLSVTEKVKTLATTILGTVDRLYPTNKQLASRRKSAPWVAHFEDPDAAANAAAQILSASALINKQYPPTPYDILEYHKGFWRFWSPAVPEPAVRVMEVLWDAIQARIKADDEHEALALLSKLGPVPYAFASKGEEPPVVVLMLDAIIPSGFTNLLRNLEATRLAVLRISGAEMAALDSFLAAFGSMPLLRMESIGSKASKKSVQPNDAVTDKDIDALQRELVKLLQMLRRSARRSAPRVVKIDLDEKGEVTVQLADKIIERGSKTAFSLAILHFFWRKEDPFTAEDFFKIYSPKSKSEPSKILSNALSEIGPVAPAIGNTQLREVVGLTFKVSAPDPILEQFLRDQARI